MDDRTKDFIKRVVKLASGYAYQEWDGSIEISEWNGDHVILNSINEDGEIERQGKLSIEIKEDGDGELTLHIDKDTSLKSNVPARIATMLANS